MVLLQLLHLPGAVGGEEEGRPVVPWEYGVRIDSADNVSSATYTIYHNILCFSSIN